MSRAIREYHLAAQIAQNAGSRVGRSAGFGVGCRALCALNIQTIVSLIDRCLHTNERLLSYDGDPLSFIKC